MFRQGSVKSKDRNKNKNVKTLQFAQLNVEGKENGAVLSVNALLSSSYCLKLSVKGEEMLYIFML